MKALILNSGLGSRMGVLTTEHPKCMTDISEDETILSRQLNLLYKSGIKDVVITTGYFDSVLINYCKSLKLPLNITYVKNDKYSSTNYIYSIYCARNYLQDDIVLMHGDLVFEEQVLQNVISNENSCMVVDSTLKLPEKDFKAVVYDKKIEKVGIEFFDNAVAAQPLYKLKKEDWMKWLKEIVNFCETDNVKCYAENAFNRISESCNIYPFDANGALCSEIDNPQDLEVVTKRLYEIKNKHNIIVRENTNYCENVKSEKGK